MHRLLVAGVLAAFIAAACGALCPGQGHAGAVGGEAAGTTGTSGNPTDAEIGDVTPASAYDFSFRSIDDSPLPLSQFRGKAVLVVNTASQCGFTPQYADLEALWQQYRDRGLMVLGVPSNDFGGQEPGSETEIKEFCAVNFNIDFPLTEKTHVRGENAHPFYRWAAAQVGLMGVPRWNFHKYLISPDGRLLDWFSTITPPDAGRLRQAVEAALPADN